MFCNSCGSKNTDNAQYCINCGAKITLEGLRPESNNNSIVEKSQKILNVACIVVVVLLSISVLYLYFYYASEALSRFNDNDIKDIENINIDINGDNEIISADSSGDVSTNLEGTEHEEDGTSEDEINSSKDSYIDYLDWCGDYDGGWYDTTMHFVLYTDGTQDPECGYVEFNFRGNEFGGMLHYREKNKFYTEVDYEGTKEKYNLYTKQSGDEFLVDIYAEDGDYECTYTMIAPTTDYDYDGEGINSSSGYIISYSDELILDKSDVDGLSLQELNYAKNEIYARHGRKFKSKELRDYFNSKDWYYVDPDYSDNMLSKTEKKNANFLADVEKKKAGNNIGYILDQ